MITPRIVDLDEADDDSIYAIVEFVNSAGVVVCTEDFIIAASLIADRIEPVTDLFGRVTIRGRQVWPNDVVTGVRHPLFAEAVTVVRSMKRNEIIDVVHGVVLKFRDELLANEANPTVSGDTTLPLHQRPGKKARRRRRRVMLAGSDLRGKTITETAQDVHVREADRRTARRIAAATARIGKARAVARIGKAP